MMSADNSTIEIHHESNDKEVILSTETEKDEIIKDVGNESIGDLNKDSKEQSVNEGVLDTSNNSTVDSNNDDDNKVNLSTENTTLVSNDENMEKNVEDSGKRKGSVGRKRKAASEVSTPSIEDDDGNSTSKRRRSVAKVDYTYSSYDKDIKDSIKNGKISTRRTSTTPKSREKGSTKKNKPTKNDEKVSVNEKESNTTNESIDNVSNDGDSKDVSQIDEKEIKNGDEEKPISNDMVNPDEVPSEVIANPDDGKNLSSIPSA